MSSHSSSEASTATMQQHGQAHGQAKHLQEQQRTKTQRKPSQEAISVTPQAFGRRSSRGMLPTGNYARPYKYSQEIFRTGHQTLDNTGPPSQGRRRSPQQQSIPNQCGQQFGPNMMCSPQYFPYSQPHTSPRQWRAPSWVGRPPQQYPGPGYFGQEYAGPGYLPFQAEQPLQGRRRSSGSSVTSDAACRPTHQTSRRRFSRPSGLTVDGIIETMQDCVDSKGLAAFYNKTTLRAIVHDLKEASVPRKIKQAWGLSDAETSVICLLALWDVWLLCDDSASTICNPDRNQNLKSRVTRIVKAGSLFNPNGVNVDFFHGTGAERVTTEAEVNQLIARKPMIGGSPTAHSLETKVLTKIRNKVAAGQLDKPVLVLILTDGYSLMNGPGRNLNGRQATDYLRHVRTNMTSFLESRRYPAQTVRYRLAGVDDDPKPHKLAPRTAKPWRDEYDIESEEDDDGQLSVLMRILLGAKSPKRDAMGKPRRGS